VTSQNEALPTRLTTHDERVIIGMQFGGTVQNFADAHAKERDRSSSMPIAQHCSTSSAVLSIIRGQHRGMTEGEVSAGADVLRADACRVSRTIIHRLLQVLLATKIFSIAS